MPNHATLSNVCEVFHTENCIPIEQSTPYDEFLIEVYVTFRFASSSSMEADEGESSVSNSTTYKPFRQKLDHLVQDTTSWSTISNMLSQVNVPYHAQPFIIWKISKAAQSIARALDNADLKTITMVGLIQVEASDLESKDSNFGEEEEDAECCSGNNTSVCVICLEEILVRAEAVSTPCSHIYHGDCIVDWLQRSRVCPLCRFQMLPESSSSKG